MFQGRVGESASTVKRCRMGNTTIKIHIFFLIFLWRYNLTRFGGRGRWRDNTSFLVLIRKMKDQEFPVTAKANDHKLGSLK
jgi:hypothetical protein